MKILHLCLCGAYSDNYEYQDNMLPLKHYELGNDVTTFVSPMTWLENGNLGEREAREYVNQYGYKVCILPYKKKKYAREIRLFENLYESIEKENPDIIFCHGGLFYSYPDLIRYLNKHKNVLLYMDSHIDNNISGIDQKSGLKKLKRFCAYRFFWGHCVRSLSRYAQKVWGVTPARVSFLKDVFRVSDSKVDLLVMGGNESAINYSERNEIRKKLRDMEGISPNTFVCVTGGKFDRHKNIPVLLKAFRQLEEDGEDIALVMLGMPDTEMKSEITVLQQNMKNVYAEGWCDTQTIYNWFLASDLAVFPGRHSVLWEQAVASGLPCCIKRAFGMEHVDVGGNCLFFDDDSPEGIANAIRKIVNDSKQYNKMLEVAQTKGINDFSYIEIAKRAIEMEG